MIARKREMYVTYPNRILEVCNALLRRLSIPWK